MSTPWRACFALASVTIASAALTIGSYATNASAMDAKTEEAAKKADQEAMDVDFLSLDMKKAKTKLQAALKKCGKNKCSEATKAVLHRDLGIVLVNSKDASGAKEFDSALAADATVTIGKDFLDNVDVKKAWDVAKKKAGIGVPAPTPTATVDEGDGDAPAAEGNLVVKVKLAPIGSELPILIEAPKGVDIAKVKVSYKTTAMDKYKVVEAKKAKSKWLASLDCTATNKAGNIKYFIKAYDADDVEAEHYGTIKKPALIKVVEEIDDEDRPLLPGDEEPKSCEAATGEGAGATEQVDKKPEGAGCVEDEECETSLVCGENAETGKKQCKPGDRPVATTNPNKVWIGADFQIDLVLLREEHDLCRQQSWVCSANTPDGRVDVGSDPGVALQPNGSGPATGGKTDGGTAVGTKRVTLSLDYFVLPNLSIGGRLGYIFGGNPTTAAKFVPLHAEARAQYFLVSGPFRPLLMLGGGYGRTEAGVPDVAVNPNDINTPGAATSDGSPCTTPTPGSDPTCLLKGVTAYKLGGPGFIALGAGAWIMLGERVALNVVPLKITFAVPTFVLAFTPEIGVKFGF